MDEFTGTVYVSVALQKHPWWIPDPLLITTEALPNIRRPWSQLIGQPLESTVAVSRLIFGGVLEHYPNLKICVAHGGGYLPYYAGRMDHAYKVRPECQKVISRPPSAYLRQLYYDTVIYTGESLSHLVRQVGSDQVLLGTDYPADMGEADPVGYINSVRSLSRADKEKIWGSNAARLLKITQ